MSYEDHEVPPRERPTLGMLRSDRSSTPPPAAAYHVLVEEVVATRVADVATERVRWLWQGRIPLGKVTVLDGDPGLGKSTFTLDLAARVSTASPLPTGERPEAPASVILLSAEDGIADTIRPRLEAAEADLDRVHVFEHVLDLEGVPRPPSIPMDVAHIERLVVTEGATLVVVDPLMAYLGAGVDSHRDQDVRRAMFALATWRTAPAAPSSSSATSPRAPAGRRRSTGEVAPSASWARPGRG